MAVQGIAWLGIRTEAFTEMVDFFTRLVGPQDHGDADMAVFVMPNGDTVEVFGPRDEDHRHFTTGPVAGLAVDDIHAAVASLRASGLEVIGTVQSNGGMAWCHFRSPDGTVLEFTQSLHRR